MQRLYKCNVSMKGWKLVLIFRNGRRNVRCYCDDGIGRNWEQRYFGEIMDEKFINRYRISSARASWWDYSNAGAYFITICTDARKHYFGRIESNTMRLSPCGTLADEFWRRIPDHSKFAVLGRYVVMPNHVHGILHVLEGSVSSSRSVSNVMSGISPQANSLSAIIRSYKSAVTRQAHYLGFEFAWQPRFYDRIIKDDFAYQCIEAYIESNVALWGQHPKHNLDDGFTGVV